ncbi:MAG TPA: site-specific integrase [Rhizomicrobium sp.]|nr:site-specific integrase [Rhizomicrobium sp.]
MNENHKDGQLVQSSGMVQNFFIVLPAAGAPVGLSDADPSHRILEAIRAALAGGTSRNEVPATRSETLAEVAREWFRHNSSAWRPSYALRLEQRLETGLLDHIGDRPLQGISPVEVLEVVRKIELRDARETARRVLRIASAVFRYGIATGRCARDPTSDLRGALKPTKAVRHRAALSARDLPKFLRNLDAYQGDLTKLAMKLALTTFVRTAELRFATWSEFENLEGAEPLWRIPAERMKMGRGHLVPLPRQAVTLLEDIRRLELGSSFVFPANTKKGVISENTLLFALYRMGYRRRATVHGFRSLASTVLNEAQFNRDWIEMQLAHTDSTVRGAYNAAEWLSGRRTMLQWWADYLESRGACVPNVASIA